MAAACTPAGGPPEPIASQCAMVAAAADTIAVAQTVPALLGEYRLVAVVDTGTAAGRAADAGLALWQADDGRVLAATTLELHALAAPSISNLASRSDSRPGLTLRGRRLVLVPVDGQPSNETEFVIDLISPAGFAGHWSSREGSFAVPVHGVPPEDAAGHFCATRRPRT